MSSKTNKNGEGLITQCSQSTRVTKVKRKKQQTTKTQT